VAAQKFNGQFSHHVSWHNPFPPGDKRNVLAQFQRGRQMTIDDEYDGLLCVEHDMWVPPNAAQAMWNTPAPVVYAPYLLRHNSNVLSTWQWTDGRNLGMSLTLYPKELAALRKAGAGPVCGVGFGCTLMRREVFGLLDFRGPDSQPPDLPFAMDCIRAGIRPWGRFDIECGHYDPDKHQWLWPWRQTEVDVIGRIYMLQTVTVAVDGDSKQLKRGHYYSLPGGTRDDLIRAGYATPLDTEPDLATPQGREIAVMPTPAEMAVATEQGIVKKRRPPTRKPAKAK
jgi:hypothetical protein